MSWLLSRMMEPNQWRSFYRDKKCEETHRTMQQGNMNARSIWTTLGHHSQVMEMEGTATPLEEDILDIPAVFPRIHRKAWRCHTLVTPVLNHGPQSNGTPASQRMPLAAKAESQLSSWKLGCLNESQVKLERMRRFG
ncbi:hypothetical protein N7519_010644 [Penicillium mononematosum]|uniref:uncharacterized protein n=1 Tax=Penicillium mononematosum TaxID=268346 RepID=UPI002546AAE8|nr:uncharacterized protein N7519_010644 [Penicillium mononematosum]KAJ6180183.1 hypothetical protein N7519_010644 [Penicillium mononematosum]